ncbi:MAG TPA: UMP kinase [Candidatus Binatus sp.]|nr:UMP kinase [Candidatus Binatus sp.]
MRAVVKLGGALFRRELEPEAIKKTASALGHFVEAKSNRLVLVAGGGENARSYITAARKLGADESSCDMLGIQITNANAELLHLAFSRESSITTTSSLKELARISGTYSIVVMGGLQPGQSTNAVAALAAEIIHANLLVNGTDVDGVYTDDPKKNPKAKLLKTVEANKLLKMTMDGEVFAGRYELLDPLAVRILQRSRIPTRFVSLSEPVNILDALQGKDIGTLIVYENR